MPKEKVKFVEWMKKLAFHTYTQDMVYEEDAMPEQ